MKKSRNQGFTLIEMLMVVAVIAVLVSIIVPQVSNASEKAAASADAANLRTAQAAIAVGILEGTYSENDTTITAEDLNIPVKSNYNGKEGGGEFSVTIENGVISVFYGKLNIDQLADIADNGKLDGSNAASETLATEAPADSTPES